VISFEKFEMQEGIPIYLQILQYIKRGVIAGDIQNEDELPSRRMLSVLLSVNPNTVQKAYHMLEEEGLIQSRAGAKSCMVIDDITVKRIRTELLETDAKNAVTALKQMGVSKEEAFELMNKYWD